MKGENAVLSKLIRNKWCEDKRAYRNKKKKNVYTHIPPPKEQIGSGYHHPLWICLP